jgi:hypothetical protein
MSKIMSEEIFSEIKDVINVISIIQARETTLRHELEFFNQRQKDVSKEACQVLYIGAAKRLEHEAMFLCIEVDSLHKGIEKKRSLYSKVIKQNGNLLSRVDKTPMDENSIMWIDATTSGKEIQEFSAEEKNCYTKKMEESEYTSRKEVRDAYGITSPKHDELDDWLSQLSDDETLSKLADYRDAFAHRLDSLEKLKSELAPVSIAEIKQMLDVVSSVLNTYKSCLTKILLYTTSEHCMGSTDFEYDSLSRLEFAERDIKHMEV